MTAPCLIMVKCIAPCSFKIAFYQSESVAPRVNSSPESQSSPRPLAGSMDPGAEIAAWFGSLFRESRAFPSTAVASPVTGVRDGFRRSALSIHLYTAFGHPHHTNDLAPAPRTSV